MAQNILWVVQGHDHPWLLSPQLDAADVSWCSGDAPVAGRYAAKTRYRQADAACSFQVSKESAFSSATSSAFTLAFDETQWAVTPGQSAVVYDGEVCLGGGVISSAVTLS
jgi:tRNA-specific 2-thiouridylase